MVLEKIRGEDNFTNNDVEAKCGGQSRIESFFFLGENKEVLTYKICFIKKCSAVNGCIILAYNFIFF